MDKQFESETPTSGRGRILSADQAERDQTFTSDSLMASNAHLNHVGDKSEFLDKADDRVDISQTSELYH